MGSSMTKRRASSKDCYQQRSSKDVGKDFAKEYYHTESRDSRTSFQADKNQFNYSNTAVYNVPHRTGRRLSNFSQMTPDRPATNSYNTNYRFSK